MLRLILASCLLTVTTIAQADADLLAELTRRSAAIEALEGSFVQTKSIAVLPVPITSTGKFSFDRKVGVLWETLEPVRNSLQISAGTIKFEDAQGKSLLEGQGPAAGAEVIARIFSGVIAGDLAALNEYFVATSAGSSTKWQIILVPRSPNLAAYIKKIELQGHEITEQLDIAEANGDATRIQLTTGKVTRTAP